MENRVDAPMNGNDCPALPELQAWPYEQLQAVVAGLHDGVSVMTVGTGGQIHFLQANDRYFAIFGYTREQYRSFTYNPLAPVHPDDRVEFRAQMTRVAEAQEPASFRFRCIRGDGAIIHLRCVVSSGDIPGIADRALISVITDVSSVVAMEQQAIRDAEQLKAVLGQIGSGVTAVILGEDRQVEPLLVTDRYYELLGYTREQFHKELKNAFEPISQDDVGWVLPRIMQLNRVGQSETLEYRVIRRDGQEIWLRDTVSVVQFSGIEKPVQLSVFMDITGARQLADQLRAMTENVPGGLAALLVSPGVIHIEYFNEGFYAYSGYTREEFSELIRDDAMHLVFPEDVPALYVALARFQRGDETAFCTFRCRTKDGGYRWLELRGTIAERRGEDLIIYLVQMDVTELKEAEEHLRVQEMEYRLSIEQSGKLIYRYNHSDSSVDLTPSVAPIFGLAPHLIDVPESLIANGMVAEESVEQYREFYRCMKRGDKTGSMTIQRRTAEGNWRWYAGYFNNVFDRAGEPISAIVVFDDVTQQREQEAVYLRWQQSLEEKDVASYTMFRWNLSRDAMIEGSVQGSLLLYRIDRELTAMENNRAYGKSFVVPEDREKYIAFVNPDSLLAGYYRGKRIQTLEYRELQPDNILRWIHLTAELMEYPGTSDICAYLMYENVDEKKKSALAVKELAENDALTGVLNRATFTARVANLIAETSQDQQCALMMLDVDGFKLLNDSFGHAAGDQALVDIASAISSVLRHGDLLGRLGGDEFLICMRDVPHEADVEKKAQTICSLVRKAYSLEVQISASIGIALCPRDGTDFEVLYRKVDAALYIVKESGKDNYAFFREDMGVDNFRSLSPYEPAASIVRRNRQAKRRMLIVEDNAIDAATMAAQFSDDYIIDRVKDGSSALIRLRHYGTSISVVLLDLMLDGMSGFEVLEKMHATPELQAIPVIVVSGSDDRETSLRVIKSGAADFVAKPIDPELVRLRVSAAVSRAENERLRAQNSFLALQNNEINKYRAVVESIGMTVVEYDYLTGTFVYDSSITEYLAGTYDTRKLWHIFLSDFVADVKDVKEMQSYVFDVASNRDSTGGSMTVMLRTPSRGKKPFTMEVIKVVNEFMLTDKIILTFREVA